MVAELRGHERQAVEESEQWKTHHEKRKVIGGASGWPVRDDGQGADKLVTRIAPGVVSPVAELRGPRAAGGRGDPSGCAS